MKSFVDKNTKVCVQGITGRQGAFHTKRMLEYGTKIVCGVTPEKGGSFFEGVPVYNTVAEARKKHEFDATINFVPAKFTYSAAKEAFDAGIKKTVIITEGVPVHDMFKLKKIAKAIGATIIGPNCPGVIVPGQILLGIMPTSIFKPGEAVVISRSGTLTYEVVNELTKAGVGQKICLGLGGDPISGTDFSDSLKLIEGAKTVVIIGEIGGKKEELVAELLKKMKMNVFAIIAGKTAPKGKKMGHAGAIIDGNVGTYESKVAALGAAGAKVADTPRKLAEMIKKHN